MELRKYSDDMLTSAVVAYSWWTRSFLQMSAAMSSMAVMGFLTLSSTTSLRTSTFLDIWDPF